MELNLPQGDLLRKAKVFSRSKDEDCDMKGSHESNIFPKTLTFYVELPNGEIKEHQAKVVAENMHAQADNDVHAMQILDAIVKHRKDANVVDKADMRVRTKSGQQYLRHATSGWSLIILWNNGEEE